MFSFSLTYAQIDLGPDIEACTGSTVVLDATIPGESPFYTWVLNDTTFLPENGPILNVTQAGRYYVETIINNIAYTDEIVVHINDEPEIWLQEMEICDDATIDGFASFDLNSIAEQTTIDFINNTVAFYLSESDALTDVNQIISPYTNTNNYNQTIYIRLQNANGGCFSVNPFYLSVLDNSVMVNDPAPLEICSQTDFATFNLSSKNSEINNEANVNVTYFLSQTDADANTNPLPNVYDNISNPQTVYVRVQNQASACYRTTQLELIVNDGILPQANSVNSIELCDSSANFDLTAFEPTIIGGQSNVTISFFETSNDAVNNINSITNPFAYTGLTIGQNSVYARVDSNTSNCYNYTEIIITVNELPEVNSTSLFGCASDGSGIASFDLVSQISLITTEQNVDVSFFETEADALNNSNTIANPSTYFNTVNPQIIYVRVEDFVTGCINTTTLELNVEESAQITSPTPLEVCDDDNDGFSIFDLESKNAEILGSNDPLNYNVLYFETLSDAENSNNPVFSPYSNIVSSIQTIYVRVESNNSSDCNSITTLDLLVTPIPVPANPTPLFACDENNDGIIEFDLTAKTDEIINGETDIDITYHISFVDAETNNNAIVSPYTTPGTVFARATSLVTGCYTIVELMLSVEACPQIVNCSDVPFNFEYCYDVNDSTQYVFESSDGSPLSFRFNAGQVEFDYDYLVVLDSDGMTNLNSTTPYGNNGDLSGLVFSSTGNRISFYVDSDGIISCSTENYTPINIDVFCTNAYGIITVNTFEDLNANGTFDTNEPNFSNGILTYELNNNGNISSVNSSTGSFNILSTLDTDSYDITYALNNDYTACYTVSSSAINDVSVMNGNSITIDIPVVKNNDCEDLGIYLINPNVAPRPGFSHNNILTLENLGNTIIASGTIEFISDSEFTILNTTSSNPSYVITNNATGITVDFTNLLPGDSEEIEISLNTAVSATLGATLTNEANYTTNTNDLISENNTTLLSEVVIGSWDPNDKMEAHGPQIVFNDFIASDEYLYYTIRFQNLGTSDAVNIRIEDVLNSQLDETTFQMLRSSHDFVVTKTDSDLEWLFQNINLPAEQDDELGSQGYVYFKIKPKSGYALNDIIPNSATIYFDFNAPVITNIFETQFVEALSIAEFNLYNFELYPIPASRYVTLKLNSSRSGKLGFDIFDIQGKSILTGAFNETNTYQIDVSQLESGMYFVQLKSKFGNTVKKLIIE